MPSNFRLYNYIKGYCQEVYHRSDLMTVLSHLYFYRVDVYTDAGTGHYTVKLYSTFLLDDELWRYNALMDAIAHKRMEYLQGNILRYRFTYLSAYEYFSGYADFDEFKEDLYRLWKTGAEIPRIRKEELPGFGESEDSFTPSGWDNYEEEY